MAIFRGEQTSNHRLLFAHSCGKAKSLQVPACRAATAMQPRSADMLRSAAVRTSRGDKSGKDLCQLDHSAVGVEVAFDPRLPDFATSLSCVMYANVDRG